MANFSAKIMNTAIGSLNAQQAVIANTSNNIANANSPGYSRRVLNLQNRVSRGEQGTVSVGSGVEVASLTRVVDEYINKTYRDSNSEKFARTIEDQYISRTEDLFSLSDDRQTIGTTLTKFFSALNDLTLNPASIELRSNALASAQDLVSAIGTSYNTIAGLQSEADSRLRLEIESVNTITQEIADLNVRISTSEGGGQVAADERDRRDALLEQLSEKIDVDTIELSDGSINVTLPTGLALVTGSVSRALETTTGPSFAGGSSPPSLDGGILNFVVFNYGTTAARADVDLTSTLAQGNGVIGGLLRMRGVQDTADTSAFEADGFLPELAAKVEAITRTLLTQFNQTYLGPDENGGLAGHQPSSADLDGNTPSVYGFFDFNFSGGKDSDTNGLPDDLGTHAGVDNYSSLLQLAISSPREIAAARDLNPAAGATSFVQGDGSNIQALVALQTQTFTFSTGAVFSASGTFEEIYNQTVGFVGNERAQAATKLSVAESKALTAANRRDEISAVSLDEEFTNLIRFQKAFEGSARMIKISQELLDQIINLI